MPSNTHTVVGGTKRLECRVVGHPAPDIRWFKDGRDITHSGRYNFDFNTSNGVISMVIDNISHKDQGNYRCRAENTEGFASTSAYLLVRAHREHPDEEIEEVHAMELEELFVYKSAEAHSITTERLSVGTNDIDSARKRTFEDIVDGEKENGFDGRYKMVGKDISGKRSSESTILSELNAEEASSRRQVDGFEETQETIKKMKMVLEESSRTSLAELAEHESKSSSKTSTKSISESRSESSYAAKMETQALSAKTTKSEETNLQASSYVEETSLKGRKESRQSELVMGVSVETEESSKLSSKSRSEKSLVASIESEQSSSKAARKTMSAEVTETEISSKISQEVSSRDSTKEKKVVSVETKESNLESRMSDVQATSEMTKRLEEEQRSKVTDDTSVEDTKGEEVPEVCRMEPQEVDADRLGDLSMTGSALNSLANDSGFMEASLLESTQLQLDESTVSQSVESSVETSSLDQAKVSTEQEVTDTKAKTARKESFVEESQLTEVIEESTQVQQTELSQSTQESRQIISGETEITESTSAKTAVTSQETSHIKETREEFSEDITGLLDEKTEQTTVVEEEEVAAAAEEDGEHRTRWVDQITSKTETITIEGEGKKTKELKAIEETAVSAESISKKEQSAQLDKAKAFKEESKIEPVDSQAVTEAEEVSKLAEAEQTAAAVLEAETKAKASKEEAKESSVDPISLTNGVDAKAEDISSSEANVEKSTESEEKSDLIQSSDVAVTEDTTKEVEEKVDESEERAEAAALSAPKIMSVSDDVAVSLGEAIRLASRVQGNPQPEVKWFKEGDTVKAGERITLRTEDDVFTLEINEAAAGDAGTYTLTAHNSEGTIFSDVLVTVSIPPSIGPADEEIRVTARLTIPEFVAQPGNVTVRELGTLELVCTIKANPSPTVSWSKAGKPLQADSHMRIFDSEGQYHLEIPRASMDDAGDYTCTASNSEGSVSCTIAAFVESRESSVSATDEGAAAMVPLGQRESSSDERFMRVYEVIRAYQDPDTKVLFVVGDIVEILDSRQKSGIWLVRNQVSREQVCFVPSSHLKEVEEAESGAAAVKKREPKPRSPTNRLSSEMDWVDTSEDEERTRLRENYPTYLVIADYMASQTNGENGEPLKLTEGQIVEVMDMERADRWLVQTRPTKLSTAKQGWVPPAYLEAKTPAVPASRRSTREVFREDVLQISNKQQEALLKRRYAVTELVESEREYVRELERLMEKYYKRLGRRSGTPTVLKDKRDLIFSNIQDILDFHKDGFLRVIEASVANPGTIGDSFLIKEKKFNMYIQYWIDHLSSAVFLETEEAQQFLKEYSRSIGDSETTLSRLLQCPIMRLASYQILLKDILRYTSRAGDDCSSMERAIAMLTSIELQVKHHMLLQNIEGLPGDVSSLGQLTRHDDFITWDSEVTQNSRAKERHVFLFRDKAVICKKRKGESATDQPSFCYKGMVELQNVQVNEYVLEDERRLEFWYATATTEKLTFQAKNVATKQAWLKDTRELLKALGVEETDIMPERSSEVSSSSSSHTTSTVVQKKKVTERTSTVIVESGSDSDRTLTDDYASLSSYESDISSYHTAQEFEDGSTRPVFKRRPKKTVCQEGGTVKFECTVGGTPLPGVKWLKDGATIKESETVQVTNEGDTSTLTLTSVTKKHSGQYSALAANLNGSILSAAELVVLEELASEKAEPGFDQAANGVEDKTPTEETPPTSLESPEEEEKQESEPESPVQDLQTEALKPSSELEVPKDEIKSEPKPEVPNKEPKPKPEPEAPKEEPKPAQEAPKEDPKPEPEAAKEEPKPEPEAPKEELKSEPEPEAPKEEPKPKPVVEEAVTAETAVEEKKATEPAVEEQIKVSVDSSVEEKKAARTVVEELKVSSETVVEESKTVKTVEQKITTETSVEESKVFKSASEEQITAATRVEEKPAVEEELKITAEASVEDKKATAEEGLKITADTAVEETRAPVETYVEEKKTDEPAEQTITVDTIFEEKKAVVEDELKITSETSVEEKKTSEVAEQTIRVDTVVEEKKASEPAEQKITVDTIVEEKKAVVEEEVRITAETSVEEKKTSEVAEQIITVDTVVEEKKAVVKEHIKITAETSVEEKKTSEAAEQKITVDTVVEEKKAPEPAVEEQIKPKHKAVKEKAPEPIVEEKKVPEPVAEEKKAPKPVEKKKAPEPVVEEKKVPEPVVEEKKVPEPVFEEKKVLEPVVEEKKVPEPVVEEKKVPEPVVEEKKVPEPVEEKKAPEPVVEKKKIPESVEEKKIPESVEEKKIPKPFVEEKKIPEPVVEKKKIPEPVVEEKKALEPVEEKKVPEPVVEEKKTSEPVEEKKKVAKPVEEKKKAPEPVEEKKKVAEPVEEKKKPEPVVEEKKVPELPEEKKQPEPPEEKKPAVSADYTDGQKPSSLEPQVEISEASSVETSVRLEDSVTEAEEATEAKSQFKPIPAETPEGEVPIRCPHFLAEMNDVVIELGQLARFDCRVAAYPDPEITWLKDGNKVVPTDRYVLQNFHDDIFSLLIKDVKVTDSGRYTCHAKNEYGEAETEALLNVLALQGELDKADMAPSFATKFGNVECVEGVPVEFTCQIRGRPPPSITWLINGKEVTPSLEILTRQHEDTIMLAFRSVQLEHSGDIICKLKNHLGEATCRAKLKVNEDLAKKGECPLFMERPSDLEVMEGGEARFECVVSGIPNPEVIWYFNGRELFDSRRRVIRKKGDKYTLILREVIADNAGVYTCKAVNAAGDASCAVELSVKEIPKQPAREAEEVEFTFPPTFTRRLLDQRVAPGRTARFECLMLGLPLPDVEWQKEGKTLKPSEKYRVGREGSTAILEIDNADLEDAGEYTCILVNDSGKATSKAGLIVQEDRKVRGYPSPLLEVRRPEFGRAPSKGREEYLPPIPRPSRELSPEEKVPYLPFDKPSLLDIRDDSVKISWLPARTAGLPENARHITYTIEAREMPSNRWTRLASGIESTTHVARNLRKDRDYMFRVYAENKYGPSEPTLPATLSAREEPEEKKKMHLLRESPAPLQFPSTRPYVMDIGAETLRLGWRPAEYERKDRNLTPVSYRVEAQKLPSEEWVPLASRVRDTSLYLSDLESDRDYNVRVRAQGPYGVSQPTAPIWLPRAAGFSGVPVSRPQITELEPDTVRLQWRRVNIPTFAHEQDPLLYMIEMQESPSTHWREVASRVSDTYYVIHDLEPATDYRFRVRALTRDGLKSEPSPATSIHRTLALSRPPVDQLEVYDYEPDYETVGLQWRRVEIPPFDNAEEPLLYMIECQEPQADSWRPLVSGIPTTRYRVPDIGPTQDYQFRVRALTPYGMSPPSPATGLYRHPSPMRPLAQDLYISSMEPESVRLSWQPLSLPSTRPTSYQVEALEYPSSQWRPLATDVRDTSYQLSGIKPTKDYSFRVRALTDTGLTEPTSPVTLTTMPVRPRMPFKSPVISQMGTDSVSLQWSRAELPYYQRRTESISYSLEMQEMPGYSWTPVRRGIPETSYTVTGLRADRDYRFRVRPETEYGPGEYSPPVHAYRRPAVTMPTREPMIHEVGPNSITLNWLPAKLPSGISTARPISYRIQMREPPSGDWTLVADRIPTNSYNINFLNPDRDYLFRVFAELDGVESEPTGTAFLPHRMGPPKMLREPPLISSVHPDSVWLSWRSVDIPSRITDYAPVTYRIEAQEPPHSEWRPVARHIPQTHFHLQGLRPGQEYNFRIRAENTFGLSEPTPSVLLKRRSVPPIMTRQEPLISDVSPGGLRLTWRPAEVPSYLLDSVPVTYSIHYQHLPDMEWMPLARRVVGTSYFVTGLSPDNNYAFRIQAENVFGSSMPTNPARMPRLAEIPAPIYSPEIEEIEPSALRLAWRTPKTGPYKSKKTTYAIETLEPSTWTWRPLVSNLATPSYRVSTLLPTQDYVFRIRAEADKLLSEPSFPVTYSRTRAPPAVPVERPILSEIESDSVRVSWHPIYIPSGRIGGSRRYRLEMREVPYGQWHPAVMQTTQLSHEVTGLKPNSDYSFRVSLVTDEGTSPPSNAAYLYRRPVIPRLPLEMPELADVTDDSVSLRWKLVDVPAFEGDDEPLSFMIEAQHLPSYDWEPLARGITDTSYRIRNLLPRQDYAFRVRGELPSGITSPSVPIPLYRRPERAGVPISYVTVDDRNVPPYSARLRWKPVYIPPFTSPSNSSYLIEMREPPTRDWRPLASDIRSTEYMVSDLSPRKSYMFRVRAKSPAGVISEPSMPVPFYPLYARTLAGQPRSDFIMPNEDFSLPDRPYISTLIVKVPPRMHIEKPNMVLTSPASVHLTWNAARVPAATMSLSPTTYRVEVREDGTFNWVERASNIVGLGCDISGLDPRVDYAFRVRAVNDFGWSEATLPVFLHRPIELVFDEPEIDWESFSPSVHPIIAPRLPIDSPRITPLSLESLRLSWHPARIPVYARKAPITYVVEMKEPSERAWSPVASKLQDTTYQVTGLEPVRPYLFRVRAESEYGTSEPTLPAELSRTKPTAPRPRSQSVERQKSGDHDVSSRRGSFIDSITAGVPPRVPTGRPTISDGKETSCTLSWPAARLPAYLKNTKLDYIIEYREADSRLWVNLAENIPETIYKVTGLDPEQDYLFRVRSHNESGTSEPTLPATLERPKKKASTPQRRGSSVERRSLDRRSMDRRSAERLSLSRQSLERRSESCLSRKDGTKTEVEEETLPGMTPDDTPHAPEFSSLDKDDVQFGVESHPMTISLHLRGYPPPQVTWYHQGKKLALGDRYDTYITPTGQVFLEFLNMGWQDVGEYKCVAENELGTAEKTVKVDVADPPTFIEPLRDVNVVDRGTATLTCSVDGIPYPTVRFMRDWRPLTDTSRLVVTNDPSQTDRWTLTITEAIPADSGSYMCVAENVAGKVFCSSRVTVEDDAPSTVYLGYKDASFEDNYYVLEEIGRGRHGVIRRVIEKTSGQEYAAKFIQVRDAVDKEFFRSELNMLRRQKHNNVVSVHDAYETPRQLIIVTELLSGGELLDRVVSYGNWTEGRAAGVIKQMLETLQHIHSSGVIHLDIKPSNLLLSGDGLDTAKLIDFGFARKPSPSQDTFLNHGTPGFTSPEVLDVKPVTTASDVWGAGVLAYILLGGQSPFQADSVAESLKKTQACEWSFDVCKTFTSVSKDAKDFITKILQKNADERPTVDELLSHPWLKKTDGGAKIDVSIIKAFQDRDKAQRQSTATRTVAMLRTLQRQLTGTDAAEKALRPAMDPKTGAVSFPDTEAYGEFLDSESWYEWQSRYGQGPDSGLLPLKDPEYTVRVRGYRRSAGSVDDSSSAAALDDDEVLSAAERERYKMMKERRLAADIDKEEIPPSLEKELQWLEERKQARKAHQPQRQDSVDSRRSSVSGEEVTGPIPVFRQRLQDLSFETGDTITMYCALEGPPPYSTVWYKNEELLSDGSRVKQELYEDGQATLTVTAAKPYDAGVYKCVARSKSGRASSRMRLLLGDVPGRTGWPVVLAVAAEEAILIWEAPRSEGNCPILYYKVDYKARGDTRWTTAIYTPLETCLVCGLQPGTSYRFRVSAVNLLGRGPFSWSTVEVTMRKEGTVSSVTVSGVNVEVLKARQEEGKATASKQREPESQEEPALIDKTEPILQTSAINTEYVLGETLWKGRFGQMKDCTSKKTSKRCLVKVVPSGVEDRLHEYNILKSVRHETILLLVSAFSTDSALFLVFEGLPGEHVIQRLSLRRRYSEDSVAYIIRQVLYGLQYLHRSNLVHLNLQPSSLLLTAPRGLDIKLADFSLAQAVSGPEGLAVPRKGYPDFIAPEVVVKEKATFASDVWGVGTLAFLLLSGMSPFCGATDEETLINVAYSRYDAGDLLDGVSNESLKFLFKVMKRLPRNRPTVQECLEQKWLHLTDTMMKTRESNLFLSNRLRNFVLDYDLKRQSDDLRMTFDDLVLPPELVTTLQPDVLTADSKESEVTKSSDAKPAKDGAAELSKSVSFEEDDVFGPDETEMSGEKQVQQESKVEEKVAQCSDEKAEARMPTEVDVKSEAKPEEQPAPAEPSVPVESKPEDTTASEPEGSLPTTVEEENKPADAEKSTGQEGSISDQAVDEAKPDSAQPAVDIDAKVIEETKDAEPTKAEAKPVESTEVETKDPEPSAEAADETKASEAEKEEKASPGTDTTEGEDKEPESGLADKAEADATGVNTTGTPKDVTALQASSEGTTQEAVNGEPLQQLDSAEDTSKAKEVEKSETETEKPESKPDESDMATRKTTGEAAGSSEPVEDV